MKVSELIFDKIKDAKKDGLTSKECADEMSLDLKEVNIVYTALGWNSYSGENKAELVTTAQAGYYKSLIAKNEKESGDLKENRSWLIEQVSFLRKSVAFLETRKRDLEDGIKELEKQVYQGVGIMEQLEDNDHFEKLSEKAKKLNK